MNPVAIVLNGTSSAGKSSIAKSIQRQSSTPVLHAQLDSFLSMFDWPALATLEKKPLLNFEWVMHHFKQPIWHDYDFNF